MSFNLHCFICIAGEKSGKGFYLYDAKRRMRPDPEIKEFVEQSRKFAELMPDGKVGLLLACHWCSQRKTSASMLLNNLALLSGH